MQVLDCGDSDFCGIAFLTLGEARRGEAWRGVFWTLVGLRDDLFVSCTGTWSGGSVTR